SVISSSASSAASSVSSQASSAVSSVSSHASSAASPASSAASLVSSHTSSAVSSMDSAGVSGSSGEQAAREPIIRAKNAIIKVVFIASTPVALSRNHSSDPMHQVERGGRYSQRHFW